MKKSFHRVLFLLACLFIIPAAAQEEKTPPEKPASEGKNVAAPDLGLELRNMGIVTVTRVIDPLRTELDDGRIVQLSTLDFPDLAPERAGDLSALALDRLRAMLEQKRVTLYQTKNEDKGRRNRMGYHLGHLVTHNPGGADDNIWVQGSLIASGLARILPVADNTEAAEALLALESTAIENKAGLWAEGKFPVLTDKDATSALNTYAVVEGVVLKTAAVNNVVYLNFDDNWMKDFSIGIPPEVRQKLSRQGVNPLDFAGKRIRVRGWVENYNGPYIKLADPAWLQVLPDPPPADTVDDNR